MTETVEDVVDRYETLLSGLRDGIVMQGTDLVIRTCNAAAERILGLSRDQMMGLSSVSPNWRAVHEDGSAFPGEAHPAPVAVRSGQPVRDVVMGVHKPDGTLTWIMVNATPLFDRRDGCVSGVVTSFSDITTSRIAQAELHRTQRFHRSVTDNLPALISYWDRDLICRFANRSLAEWLGRPIYQVVGVLLQDLVPAQTATSQLPFMTAALEGEPQHFKMTSTHRDGTRRYLELTYIPDGSDGKPDGFYALVMDVTEQHLAEERARQAEKMQIIGRLAAGVAHDFNNILQSIIANLELISDGKRDVGALAEIGLRAAERGAQLTHHMLSYARKQMLTPAAVTLSDLIDSMRTLVERTMGVHIRLEVSIAPDLPDVVVDRSQLETALLNLVINAADAMPGGGSLCLDLTTHEGDAFGDLPPGRYAVIAVLDSGTGLSEEVMAHAFEPFFTTKGPKGTGLGLAMVQGFSRQSHGDVRVTNRPEGGARVEIWLPAAKPATKPSRPALSLGRDAAAVASD